MIDTNYTKSILLKYGINNVHKNEGYVHSTFLYFGLNINI